MEAREAIHITIKNPALNHNMEKMYIPEIFNNLFKQMNLPMILAH